MPTVIELDLGFRPEAAISGELLLQDDRRAVLTFNAMAPSGDGLWHPVGHAWIELVSCEITKFGYPNDEAQPGHPLAPCGLGPYGCYEVLDSDWPRELTEVNRVSFPETPDDVTSRHFVFTFHESTFECLAADLEWRLVSLEELREGLHGILTKSLS